MFKRVQIQFYPIIMTDECLARLWFNLSLRLMQLTFTTIKAFKCTMLIGGCVLLTHSVVSVALLSVLGPSTINHWRLRSVGRMLSRMPLLHRLSDLRENIIHGRGRFVFSICYAASVDECSRVWWTSIIAFRPFSTSIQHGRPLFVSGSDRSQLITPPVI